MLEWLGLPDAGSAHAGEVDTVMVLVHWLMVVLFVGWSAFFAYVLIRFRRTAHPAARYHGLRGRWSTWIEGGVRAAEIVLLAFFSIPVWSARVDAFPSERESTVVRVVAEQFAWNVHYPGADGRFGRTDISLLGPANPLGLDRTDPAAKDDIATINRGNTTGVGRWSRHASRGKGSFLTWTGDVAETSCGTEADRPQEDSPPLTPLLHNRQRGGSFPTPHRASLLPPPAAHAPPVETREDLIQSFLSDAAHVGGGFAAGVAFPKDAGEVAALVAGSARVLPIGAQSSLTGGATPRGEVLIGTRRLTGVTVLSERLVRVGAGVSLAELQRALAVSGLYYPPAPTFDGALVGGTIATNAAGAATFKYGSTREWVEALTVVLADGSRADMCRGDVTASPEGWFEIVYPSGAIGRVPLPTYAMPAVAKLSAGYFARPEMDLIDLFVGSEGTLGIIVAATLRVIPLPRRSLVLLRCDSDHQAIAVAAALRHEAASSWRGEGPLDVAAIEYVDWRALANVPDEAFSRAGVLRPTGTSALLFIQVEVPGDETDALQRLDDVLASCGVHEDPHLASPGDERQTERLFALREAVPAAINARVAMAKASVHPQIEKTAGDLIVPFDRLEDALALYRGTFERLGLNYAIWGHLSDGNLHPNVIPHALEDMERGRSALLDISRRVIAMGGAPLAEHGVGRSALKQRLLRELYGERGIDEMRASKRALDPTWKLAPGVLFPEPT